jgi:hypothetical protein
LIISYSDVDIEQRKVLVQKALNRHGKPQGFDNIHIDFYKGQLGSVFQLEEVTRKDGETARESSTSVGDRWRGPSSDREAAGGIVWEDITRAFVMANDKEQDPAKADAISMTAALQVQTRLEDRKVPVILELRDASSREVCNRIGLQDVVSSSELPAQVIAAIELQPVFKDLFPKLFGSSDFDISIKRAGYYLNLMRSWAELSFFDVADTVRQRGHILIGWNQSPLEDNGSPSATIRSSWSRFSSSSPSPRGLGKSEFTLNPDDKHRKVKIYEGAQLVVLIKKHGGSRSKTLLARSGGNSCEGSARITHRDFSSEVRARFPRLRESQNELEDRVGTAARVSMSSSILRPQEGSSRRAGPPTCCPTQ